MLGWEYSKEIYNNNMKKKILKQNITPLGTYC